MNDRIENQPEEPEVQNCSPSAYYRKLADLALAQGCLQFRQEYLDMADLLSQ